MIKSVLLTSEHAGIPTSPEKEKGSLNKIQFYCQNLCVQIPPFVYGFIIVIIICLFNSGQTQKNIHLTKAGMFKVVTDMVGGWCQLIGKAANMQLIHKKKCQVPVVNGGH